MIHYEGRKRTINTILLLLYSLPSSAYCEIISKSHQTNLGININLKKAEERKQATDSMSCRLSWSVRMINSCSFVVSFLVRMSYYSGMIYNSVPNHLTSWFNRMICLQIGCHHPRQRKTAGNQRWARYVHQTSCPLKKGILALGSERSGSWDTH